MIKRLMPLWLREEIVSLRETLVDGWRYQRAAGSYDRLAPRGLASDRHEARLTMDYHRVEKGLSLASPRRPFGATVRPRLVSRLATATAEDAGPSEPPYATYAEDALGALDQWNESGIIDDAVSPLLAPHGEPLSRESLSAFFHTRRSVRHFDASRPPSRSEILAAVELARNTPSVCNRQGFRAHIYFDREVIGRILRLQNGATSFADTIPALAVVTARRGLFVGPLERNQRWVDGGLFAMTLVWALHGLGLDTCMLNWAMAARTSDRLRKIADIPEGEDIVVLIAIGHAAAGARVARSEKRSSKDLAVFHSAPPNDSSNPTGGDGVA